MSPRFGETTTHLIAALAPRLELFRVAPTAHDGILVCVVLEVWQCLFALRCRVRISAPAAGERTLFFHLKGTTRALGRRRGGFFPPRYENEGCP